MKTRQLSLFILMIFVSVQVSWSAPIAGTLPGLVAESPGFINVEIPNQLASLEETYEAPNAVDSKLLIHIQDLHGSFEAQSQIKDILTYLYSQYGFNLLFLEGAVGDLKPQQIELFPDVERNQKLVEDLAKKGEMTGAEMFLSSGVENVHAVGIEQTELYRKNFMAFRKIHSNRDILDPYETAVSNRLETLSTYFFSRDMRRILKDWRKFEQGHRDFLPFVKRLSEDSKKFIGLDLESLFAQVEWPQITRLLVLQAMEKDLNEVQYKKEKELLNQFLVQNNAREGLVEAVKKLGSQQVTLSRLETEQQKLEHLPRYLLERLVAEAGPKGFYFHDYPAFSLYAGYLILKSELDSKNLFDEIERVFGKILDELAVTESEKNILELCRDIEVLRKLFHLELNHSEWAQAVYRKDWIAPKAILKRLETIGDEDGSKGKVAQEKIVIADEAEVMDLFETAYLFYQYARERDTVFYDSIEKEMKARGSDKAIVVTGGFHTDGLVDIFREKQVNYGVLMPRVTQIDFGKESYLSAMLENKETMFDLNTIVKALLMRDRARELDQEGGPGIGMGTSGVQGGRIILESFLGIVDDVDDLAEIESIMTNLDLSFLGHSVEKINPSQYRINFSDGSIEDIFFKPIASGFSVTSKSVTSVDPPDDDLTFSVEAVPTQTAIDLTEIENAVRSVPVTPRAEFNSTLSYANLLNNEFAGIDVALKPFDTAALSADASPELQTAAVAGGVMAVSAPAETMLQNFRVFAAQASNVDVLGTAFAMKDAAQDVSRELSIPSLANNNRGSFIQVVNEVPTFQELVVGHFNHLSIQVEQYNAIVVVRDRADLSAARSEARALMEQAMLWADANGENIVAKGRFNIEVTTPRLAQRVISKVSNMLNASVKSTGLLGEDLVVMFNQGLESLMQDGVWLGTVVYNNIPDVSLQGAANVLSAMLSQNSGDAALLNRQYDEPMFVTSKVGFEFGPGITAFAQNIWQKITEAAMVAKSA